MLAAEKAIPIGHWQFVTDFAVGEFQAAWGYLLGGGQGLQGHSAAARLTSAFVSHPTLLDIQLHHNWFLFTMEGYGSPEWTARPSKSPLTHVTFASEPSCPPTDPWRSCAGRLSDKSPLVRKEALRLLRGLMLDNPFLDTLSYERYATSLQQHEAMLKVRRGQRAGLGPWVGPSAPGMSKEGLPLGVQLTLPAVAVAGRCAGRSGCAQRAGLAAPPRICADKPHHLFLFSCPQLLVPPEEEWQPIPQVQQEGGGPAGREEEAGGDGAGAGEDTNMGEAAGEGEEGQPADEEMQDPAAAAEEEDAAATGEEQAAQQEAPAEEAPRPPRQPALTRKPAKKSAHQPISRPSTTKY